MPALLILSAALLRRRRSFRITLLLLLLALLGGWRYHSHPLEPCLTPSDLALHSGSEGKSVWTTVEAVVSGYPEVGDRITRYQLSAHMLEADDARIDVSGKVLVQLTGHPEFEFGDELRVSGLLREPPCYSSFRWREHLGRRSIHSVIKHPGKVDVLSEGQGDCFWAVLYRLRDRFSDTINRLLPSLKPRF